jgi:hypothetical protein
VTGAGDETLRFWNVFSKARSQKVKDEIPAVGFWLIGRYALNRNRIIAICLLPVFSALQQ